MRDAGLAQPQGLLAGDGGAVFVQDRGQADDLALVVQHLVHEGHGEGARQVVKDGVLRRQVNGQIGPFLRRDLRQPPFHHRLHRADDLDHSRTAFNVIATDRRDQGRRLQPAQQGVEEPLGRAGERRERHRSGHAALGDAVVIADPDRLEGGAQVGVDDLEGVGPSVPDLDVLRRQFMAKRLVFDAVETERPGRVQTQGLQFPGDQLHDRDAAAVHRVHEGVAREERRVVTAP